MKETPGRIGRITNLTVPEKSKNNSKTLSLCMIVRNEEDFLPDCLKSVKGLADQIVVIDTGSTDRTPDIAKSLGAEVYFHKWQDDYSDARNISISYATGDWVLILDADETLDESAARVIRSAVSVGDFDAYQLIQSSYLQDDSFSDVNQCPTCRLFRNKPEYKYEGIIHEHILFSIKRSGGKVGMLDAHIHHKGYQSDVMTKQNKHERYIKLILKALEQAPENLYYLHTLAAAYCSAKQYDKALPHLKTAASLVTPESEFAEDIFSQLITSLYISGKHNDALAAAQKAEQLGLKHPALCFDKANVLMLLERYEEAIASFKSAIDLGNKQFWNGDSGVYGYKAYFGIASAYVELGDIDRSLYYISKTIKVKPNHLLVCKLLLRIFNSEKNKELTHNYYNRLSKLCLPLLNSNKADKEIHTILAECAEAIDDADSALQHYIKAIELAPADANLYFSAGDLLYSCKIYQDAAELYKSGLSIDPLNAPGFFTLGNCCFQLGAHSLAAKMYKQALEINPNYSEASHNLSLVEEITSQAA